mmetsp:Transcript_4925/g.14827  ORF Transcript_4925/g.14827 Transcript_4925/m.14827 type:complete len:234 (+) Transcript_4925:952-1653(+)
MWVSLTKRAHSVTIKHSRRSAQLFRRGTSRFGSCGAGVYAPTILLGVSYLARLSASFFLLSSFVDGGVFLEASFAFGSTFRASSAAAASSGDGGKMPCRLSYTSLVSIAILSHENSLNAFFLPCAPIHRAWSKFANMLPMPHAMPVASASTTNPSLSCETNSLGPPCLLTTTGFDAAHASSVTIPNGSLRLGMQTTSQALNRSTRGCPPMEPTHITEPRIPSAAQRPYRSFFM